MLVEPIKKAPPYDSVALLKLLIKMNTIVALVVAALTKSACFGGGNGAFRLG